MRRQELLWSPRPNPEGQEQAKRQAPNQAGGNHFTEPREREPELRNLDPERGEPEIRPRERLQLFPGNLRNRSEIAQQLTQPRQRSRHKPVISSNKPADHSGKRHLHTSRISNATKAGDREPGKGLGRLYKTGGRIQPSIDLINCHYCPNKTNATK